MRNRFFSRPTLGLAIVTLLLCNPLTTSADPENDSVSEQQIVALESWWLSGPTDIRLPVSLMEDAADKAFEPASLLDEKRVEIDRLNREKNRSVAEGTSDAWKPIQAPDGRVELKAGDQPREAWLMGYIEVDRFTAATLDVKTDFPVQIWVGDEEKAKVGEAESDSKEPRSTKVELHLETGRHGIWIRTLAGAGAEDWTIQGELKVPSGRTVEFSNLDPERGLSLGDLLDRERYGGLRLSPDGRYLVAGKESSSVPGDHTQRWTEIIDLTSGETVRSFYGGESNLDWIRGVDSPELVFTMASAFDEEASDVFRASLSSGDRQAVARGIENLAAVTPMPDGSGLILEISVPQDADERGFKRFRNLTDRWPGWRDPVYLVFLDWQGQRQRLTVEAQGVSLVDIQPDGSALLLSRVRYDVTERPFSETRLLELNLKTLEQRSLATLGWFGNATYSPDGKQLLITGSPALFGDLGKNIGSHPLANDYDSQAYLMSLADPKDVTPLTRDFDPTVRSAAWAEDGWIYLETQDRSSSGLVRLDPKQGDFETIPLAVDTISEVDVKNGRIAYLGSSPNRPHALFSQETDSGSSTSALRDPSEELLADVTYGDVKPWTFTSKGGDEISGRIYYPRNFDASKKYPLLVYYYGGTVPVDRSFGGRYPKEWWAAKGYVVYVLQPSGTDGFGQEFSARHVNAWGRQTADEIIEGTQKLLAEKSYLDSKRVGCLGASYGGFMTMYLQTRTDIFAAAVSHAGISNLASYWGQGWWGYLYSSVASAESFPWNNPELYVGQSPLYSADKIQTPLLLLHGDADTNVPPVESHQMYTALKVLGKEVELIEIGGQNHTIVEYEKRKLWARTIVAWFDRWLKDQPDSWEHLWGTENAPKG